MYSYTYFLIVRSQDLSLHHYIVIIKYCYYKVQLTNPVKILRFPGNQGASASAPSGIMSPDEKHRQLLLLQKEIEARTVDSSNRSLGLLYESEKVGAATGEELHRQKEQLLRTEGRLDEINSTLKQSERHLNGIKSVFGGIKNYLFAKNSGLPPPSPQQAIQATTSSQNQIPNSNSDASIGSSSSRKQFYSQAENDRLDTIRYHSYIT